MPANAIRHRDFKPRRPPRVLESTTPGYTDRRDLIRGAKARRAPRDRTRDLSQREAEGSSRLDSTRDLSLAGATSGRDARAPVRARRTGAEKSSCAGVRAHPRRRRTAPIRLLASAASAMIATIAITTNANPA